MQLNRNLYIFNRYPIYISNKSFKQNIYISKDIQFYINDLLFNLKLKKLICIGGESYLYGLCNDNINKIVHYTNSEYIYNDMIFNNKFFKKSINNNLINYNNYDKIINGDILILNIAKLNINLLNVINKRFYKYIIIINCHHLEFWKRIKYLTNFKLRKRKQFICKDYFVTVTLFKYKYKQPLFISLGGNCSISHQLQNLGIKNNSYPFDWCKISLSQLNKVLDNKFKDFTDIKIKKFSNNHEYIKNINHGSYLLNNKYNITFAHELFINSNKNINKFKLLLDKRIKRFMTHKEDYIIFVILEYQKSNEHILLELVKKLNKYFNYFKILYIKIDDEENPNNISIKNTSLDNNYKIRISNKYNYIKTIHVNKNIIDWEDWKYSNLDWHNIIFG
jgi:hypothetical protein